MAKYGETPVLEIGQDAYTILTDTCRERQNHTANINGEEMILLVEDNPNDEALTIRAFQKSHISNEITVVRDGAEALDFLFCQGEYASRDPKNQPELILLDINLPKLSGLDVLRRIRADEKLRVLSVVVLTSSREDRDIIESYQLGANSYVRKPVDFNQFLEA
jgi:two-component system, response regulator